MPWRPGMSRMPASACGNPNTPAARMRSSVTSASSACWMDCSHSRCGSAPSASFRWTCRKPAPPSSRCRPGAQRHRGHAGTGTQALRQRLHAHLCGRLRGRLLRLSVGRGPVRRCLGCVRGSRRPRPGDPGPLPAHRARAWRQPSAAGDFLASVLDVPNTKNPQPKGSRLP